MVRSLDEQALSLLQQQPPTGLPPQAIGIAVDMLGELARQLGSLRYFVLRDRAGGWGVFEWSAVAPQESALQPGTWLAAYSHREAATALQVRANTRNAPSQQIHADALEVVELEVLRILWLGLALGKAEGLLFCDRLQTPLPTRERDSRPSIQLTALRCRDLKQQLAMALRRQSPPPVA